MSYIYDPYWQQPIVDTFSCALNAYTRLLALRVDLRLPDTPAASYAAVISLFTDAIKARIAALQAHAVLARFPKSPVSWLTRGNTTELQQSLAQTAYLAKRETKVTGDGERNFGCSRG
ncbi:MULTISPECIES: YagK/YfjJ domain-containing protein [Enterobacteriaceae]|uniref:YagK/YfjJ domain-containing protein n=1 Tax=Enterobacteriaceae TaxID=543 RepID=UPI001B9C08E6|nr:MULTISPECIES: inovirus-type Gp2 protein [Enterobacteriaceae]MDE9580493.1 inovirus Gp2 family protein [Citrobacter koseri]HBC5670804.1 inovirus-type Gp2 protein [Citrobacter koseri]